MTDDSDKPLASESSYVLAARDYADVAHLKNAGRVGPIYVGDIKWVVFDADIN